MLTQLLVLDIETVPQFPSFAGLDSSLQSFFLDKISQTVPEGQTHEDVYRRRAGIFAEFGKIICISTALFATVKGAPNTLRIKSFSGHDEVQILRDFTELLKKMETQKPGFRFAGHNIREFDIPFICRRLLVHNLPLPRCLQLNDRKPWEVNMLDTMGWWKFGDHKNYISLDLLAHVLNVPTSKSDMDGSKVQDVYYRDNNLARIVAYCEKDVVATANVILRYHHQPLLSDEQVEVV